MKQRLHKFIANCGFCSRRRAELLIEAGRVSVNGRIIDSLGTSVLGDKDRVEVNGEIVSLPEPVTILFHKPAGLITSTHDTHERLTVMDFLPRSLIDSGVLPAGRLDQETEGLLIMTNQGELNHRITHPRYETPKEYFVIVPRRPDDKALQRLESGVRIEGEMTAPAKILETKDHARGAAIRIEIREGRKRQIRRMFQAIRSEVIYLRRDRIGNFTLGDTPPGTWRHLSGEEIERLMGSADETLE